MRGVNQDMNQNKKKKKNQDLQVLPPLAGCLGRVINMLDLSNGVVATKMITEKAHLDVSQAGKDRSNTFKMASNQLRDQIEDKQIDSQVRRKSPTKRSSSPTKRSGVTPVKTLMEQDMWKEGVSDVEPLNVVARLMGLNDEPVHQCDLVSGTWFDNEYRAAGFEEKSRNVKPKKERKCYHDQKTGTRHEHAWGGFSDQPSKINTCKNKHQGRESSCEKRMSLVREKFAEAKRLATDEKLLHSKEFQGALQFLSSNKDLFLKFLDEPNPLLSNNHYELLQPVTSPSEIKQITILKPSESMKRKGNNISARRQLCPDGNENVGNRFRHNMCLNVYQANSNLSERTRIVVLKPGLPKPDELEIPTSTSSSSSSTAADSEDCSMAVDAAVCSRRLAKEITWQMRMRLRDCQDEDNFLSEYHGANIEDDCLSKSEVENAKEVSGEISEDLEFGTPTSGRSWDFMSRSGSPYSASCCSQTSRQREPSVVREAKRRILERWSMVSSTVSDEEEKGAHKSMGTLGEMLTVPDTKKKQEEFGGITLESTTLELDSEDIFSCLPRSQSLPVSLSYGGTELNRVAIGSQEVDNEKGRKQSSFREKVSNLFFKSRKSSQEKLDPSGISSDNSTLKNGSDATVDDGSEGSSHFVLDNPQRLTLLNADENAVRRLMTNSCHTNDTSSVPAKDVSSLLSLGAPGIFGESRDQPCHVSVLDLDGPFLCDNNRRLLYSPENFITPSPQALSRSPLIGSFSWEDPLLEVMSPNSLRLSRLFSKADEDQDSLTFIQKLVSLSGMDREGCVFACPLDPKLLQKLSEYREEGIKLRERQSKERLLFDAVNEALSEISWTSELAAYPWGRSRSLEHKDCKNDLCNSASDEIWRVIRNWSILDKYPSGEVIERNLLVDMILKREMAVTATADMTRLVSFELNMVVCSMVLEDLVEEALVDLTNNT